FEALEDAIYRAVIKSSTPQLSASDVTIEYYASDSLTGATKAWMPLKGGSESILGVTVNYPAIAAGTQQIRISFNGDREYSASQIEAEVVIQDRPQPEITLNEAPYTIGMVYADEKNIDYEATEQAIIDAVIASA